MPIEIINVRQKFDLFTEQWSPKIIAQLNGQQVNWQKWKVNLAGTTMKTKTNCFG